MRSCPCISPRPNDSKTLIRRKRRHCRAKKGPVRITRHLTKTISKTENTKPSNNKILHCVVVEEFLNGFLHLRLDTLGEIRIQQLLGTKNRQSSPAPSSKKSMIRESISSLSEGTDHWWRIPIRGRAEFTKMRNVMKRARGDVDIEVQHEFLKQLLPNRVGHQGRAHKAGSIEG